MSPQRGADRIFEPAKHPDPQGIRSGKKQLRRSEILDTEVRRLASIRAETVIGLKLKASYASTEADSIVEDILQLILWKPHGVGSARSRHVMAASLPSR